MVFTISIEIKGELNKYTADLMKYSNSFVKELNNKFPSLSLNIIDLHLRLEDTEQFLKFIKNENTKH